MLRIAVDEKQFEELLPLENRQEVAKAVRKIVRRFAGRMNYEFFGGLDKYRKQKVSERLAIGDLFAPNICAIEFIHRNLRPSREVILDYGCGLGIAAAYLAELGFKAFGYDIWQQLPRQAAEAFQEAVSGKVELVDSLEGIRATVAMHVSIWCRDPIWEIPTLRWIIADSHYLNSYPNECPPGFRLYAEYPSYISIFARE